MDSTQAQLYAVLPSSPGLSPTSTGAHLYTNRRREIPIPSFTFNEPGSKFGEEVSSHHLDACVSMNSNTMAIKTESMAAQGLWTTPVSQGMRPRPATIHEGFSFCMGEGFEGVPAWDSSSLQMQQTPSDTMSSRPVSVHHDFYPPSTMESSE